MPFAVLNGRSSWTQTVCDRLNWVLEQPSAENAERHSLEDRFVWIAKFTMQTALQTGSHSMRSLSSISQDINLKLQVNAVLQHKFERFTRIQIVFRLHFELFWSSEWIPMERIEGQEWRFQKLLCACTVFKRLVYTQMAWNHFLGHSKFLISFSNWILRFVTHRLCQFE